MLFKNKWLLLFLLLTLLGLTNFGIIITTELANGQVPDWPRYLVNELSGSYTLLLLLPPLLWFFEKYPLAKNNLAAYIPLHLLAIFIFGLSHTLLMFAVRTPLYSFFGFGNYLEKYGMLKYRIPMEYIKQFLVYWIIYGTAGYFRELHRSREQQIRAAQLQQQLTKAHLQSLQMQLNPHFLFNTLNMISSFLYERPKDADKMLTILGEMLRITLNIKDIETHPLAEEMELINRYVEIMKTRFGEKLSIDINMQPAVLSAQIPVFILQPLLENAIKYSMEKVGRARVVLQAEIKGEKLQLTVSDNGPGMVSMTGNGVGLSNTLARLEKIYGDNCNFKLENREEGGLMVTLEIPFVFQKEYIQ